MTKVLKNGGTNLRKTPGATKANAACGYKKHLRKGGKKLANKATRKEGKIMNSLNHRRDNRSTKVFAQNIADFTERERIWIEIYAQDLTERGFRVIIQNNGVDNTGKLIENTLSNKGADADFNLTINGRKELVEVKTVPETSKTFTFKTFLLEQYIGQNALILMPRKNEYFIIDKQGMDYLLNSFPHQIYPRFCPNKPAIQFKTNDLNQLVKDGIFQHYLWNDKAKSLVDKHLDILFKKKAQ